MTNLRIASASATALFASSIASWTSARSASSSTTSASLVDSGWPCCFSQLGNVSGSIVTSAAMNGFPSPTTRHWLTSGWAREPVLEDGRRDVLAARGDQDLLLATGDPDEAVVVELADVAGVEPAVGVDRLVGRGLVVPVPVEDDRSAQQDLAVVGDPDRDAGERLADGADPQRGRAG